MSTSPPTETPRRVRKRYVAGALGLLATAAAVAGDLRVSFQPVPPRVCFALPVTPASAEASATPDAGAPEPERPVIGGDL